MHFKTWIVDITEKFSSATHYYIQFKSIMQLRISKSYAPQLRDKYTQIQIHNTSIHKY